MKGDEITQKTWFDCQQEAMCLVKEMEGFYIEEEEAPVVSDSEVEYAEDDRTQRRHRRKKRLIDEVVLEQDLNSGSESSE